MQLGTANLVWLITALPLVGFLLNVFLGRKLGKPNSGLLATVLVFASFAISVLVFMSMVSMDGEHRRAFASLLPGGGEVPWIVIGSFKVTFTALIDPLSMLMCLIVTGVGGLIHMYAMGYMAEDKDYPRFFTYLNLFIFFMLILVLGSNILLMFVGWEGVGLCSYLLISFWFEDMNNSKAGNKAFIVNRIGDVGYALGIMAIFATFGTLTFYTAEGTGFLDMAKHGIALGGVPLTIEVAGIIALLLFIGACGKSAQFPLFVWLPDAMAGPTPVSALIHAATMVTAGVVMITRVSPIISMSTMAMTVIASVGLFTAVFAATIALTQNDIKKVLAYSTVSQLGYMFLGCGVGAYSAAMFHVMTHAFFKALLFLGAGSVIHAMHHEQDMRKMGGLQNKIKTTYFTMLVGWLAICGMFPFAGFWSKDEILANASGFPKLGMMFYIIGVATAILTAFYMTRLMAKTFWTNQRFDEAALSDHDHSDAHAAEDHTTDHGDDHAHGHGGVQESPKSMLIPLIVLAALSAVGGLVGTPWLNKFEAYLEPVIAGPEMHPAFPIPVGLVIGVLAAAIGMGLCRSLYMKHKENGELMTEEQKNNSAVYQGSLNLWYFDEMTTHLGVNTGGRVARFWSWIDRNIVDGLVNTLGGSGSLMSEIFRRSQTGFVRSYALMMILGVVGVVVAVLWPIIGH
ncbi:MAG: NADH-quinone oxidoreductase subunit L [Chthonomonadales bacterium]